MLPNPTAEIVKQECDAFDRDDDITEKALRELWTEFPENRQHSHVLLKVVALNQLYHARVDDRDLWYLAGHIARLNLDSLLGQGSPEAVEHIVACPDAHKKYYSFATKYCSWNNWRLPNL